MMKKVVNPIVRHLFLAFLAVVWLIPIAWLVCTSFSDYPGVNISHFFPSGWTLDNYKL